jgi:hypothetical protein
LNYVHHFGYGKPCPEQSVLFLKIFCPSIYNLNNKMLSLNERVAPKKLKLQEERFATLKKAKDPHDCCIGDRVLFKFQTSH